MTAAARLLTLAAVLSLSHGFASGPALRSGASRRASAASRGFRQRGLGRVAAKGASAEDAAGAGADIEYELAVRVEAEVRRINNGEGFDALLNPGKLMSIERGLVGLRARLADAEGKNGALSAELAEEIEREELKSSREKRSVMRGWLRTTFRAQSYLTALAGLAVVNDAVPFFPDLDILTRCLGFWSWWLFIIPSLRAIKPLAAPEKTALNVAFIGVGVASLVSPVFTKDPAIIYWVDAVVVAASYGFGYLTNSDGEGDVFAAKADDGEVAKAAKFVWRAVDFGGGKERGVLQGGESKSGLEKIIEEKVQGSVDGKLGDEQE